jgi:uncharacterized membrane protein YccC
MFAFLARELAPSKRRIVEAVRNAVKSTVTTGLATAMQIVGPFGPLFVYRIGQPGLSFGLFEGALTIILAAAIQAAIVPITGKLLDYPGLIMAFLFTVFAAIAYFSAHTKLFMVFALTAIGTISTLYVGIFEPGQIGWGSTYTFDGILVATLVMVAFDTIIWPSSPETRLLESIAAGLERTRIRLRVVSHRYLDPSAAPVSPPMVKSTLAPNLGLLESVKEKDKPGPKRLTALLDAVMTAEHIYLEVERLAVLAEEPASEEIRKNQAPILAMAIDDLDKALARRAHDFLAGIAGTEISAREVVQLHAATKYLGDLSIPIPAADVEPKALEQANVLEFSGGLQKIADLLEPQEELPESAAAEETVVEDSAERRTFIDPSAFTFAAKLGTSVTLALLVGLTTQRADLQTILWSVVVAGLPNNYGAVLRKTFLRLAGCLMGGLAALAAMIIVSQNFDSLAAYLTAIFAVTVFSTYVAQSSEWLGYAGIQTGMTFMICYVGLAPASDIYKPLWRFWGIVLGVLTNGFVFLLLWPEYAGDKLIDALYKLGRTTAQFGREVAERTISQERIAAVERRLSESLLEVLNLADQARLEGRRSAANSAAAIESASVLIRIAYRFKLIGGGRIAGSEDLVSQEASGRRATFESACCGALETELARLRPNQSSEAVPQSFALPALEAAWAPDGVEAAGLMQLSPENRDLLSMQLESYRRLPILLRSLDSSLARITDS